MSTSIVSATATATATTTTTESATATATGALDIGWLFYTKGTSIALGRSNMSFNSFLASLAGSSILFSMSMSLFLYLRRRNPTIYLPRTFLLPGQQRTQRALLGVWNWWLPVYQMSARVFLAKGGMDSYFFERYMVMMLKILAPLSLVFWPILLPLNKIGQVVGVSGLDSFGWQNVATPSKQHRTWAHLCMAILEVIWACYQVTKELKHYTEVRQKFLTEPAHRARASATTVLIQNVPREYLDVDKLESLFGVFPGGVKRVWINRNYDELLEKIAERNGLARKLEEAETRLITKCSKAFRNITKERKRINDAVILRPRFRQVGLTNQDRYYQSEWRDAALRAAAARYGHSANNPHEVSQTIQDFVRRYEAHHRTGMNKDLERRVPFGLSALDQSLQVVGTGVKAVVGGITSSLPRQREAEARARQRILNPVNPALVFRRPAPRTDTSHPASTDNLSLVLRNPDADDETRRDETPRPDDETSEPSRPSSPVEIEKTLPGETPKTRQATGKRRRYQSLAFPTPRQSFEGSQRRYQSLILPSPASSFESLAPLGTPAIGQSTDHPTNEAGAAVSTNEIENMKEKEIEVDRKKKEGGKRKANQKKSQEEEAERIEGQEGALKEKEEAKENMDGGEDGSYEKERGDQEGTEDGKRRKSINDHGNITDGTESMHELTEPATADIIPWDPELEEDPADAAWRKWIDPKDRETMRLPLKLMDWLPKWIPRIHLGKKVDTIYHCRQELARLNVEIKIAQSNHDQNPLMNSAFIQFRQQMAAHMACQSVGHSLPKHLSPRIVEIDPNTVIWDNMSMKWWVRYLKTAVVYLIIIAMLVTWVFPIAFSASLSTLSSWAPLIPWLTWVSSIPSWLLSIIQGILPVVLTGLFTSILPHILRALTRYSGVPTTAAVEMRLQRFYFCFMFVQVFLVVTVASSITKVLNALLSDPLSIPGLLAQYLPTSSNYFYSYMLIQAFSVSGGSLLRGFALLKYLIWTRWLETTPRTRYERNYEVPATTWGGIFAVYTNVAVIALVYAVIAPFMTGLASVTFAAFWFVHRYRILYVARVSIDTGGLLFPTACNQLFTGLYTMEICLVGLFVLLRTSDGSPAGVPQAIVMVVVLLLTVLYQYLLNNAYSPLFRYLPISAEEDARERHNRHQETLERIRQDKMLNEDPDPDREIPNGMQQEGTTEATLDPRAEADYVAAERAARNQSEEPGFFDERAIRQEPEIWHISPFLRKWMTPQGIFERIRAAVNKVLRATKVSVDENWDEEPTEELEEQGKLEMKMLFAGVTEAMDDLTEDQRDWLVDRAFLHQALREPQPAVWIPQDHLEVSTDEIRNVDRFTDWVWYSSKWARMNLQGEIQIVHGPPDMPIEKFIPL